MFSRSTFTLSGVSLLIGESSVFSRSTFTLSAVSCRARASVSAFNFIFLASFACFRLSFLSSCSTFWIVSSTSSSVATTFIFFFGLSSAISWPSSENLVFLLLVSLSGSEDSSLTAALSFFFCSFRFCLALKAVLLDSRILKYLVHSSLFLFLNFLKSPALVSKSKPIFVACSEIFS